MIQKLFELQNIVTNLKKDLKSFESAQIQKLFSTGRYICITVRVRGATKYLYLGRGKGYEGLLIGESLPPKELRIRDIILEYLRKYLVSARLLDMKVDPMDRVLILKYKYQNSVGQMLFFWGGRQLYLANLYWNDFLEKGTVFLSWKGNINLAHLEKDEKIIEEELLKMFISVGKFQDDRMNLTNDEREKKDRKVDVSELLKEEFNLCLKASESKKKKILERKVFKIAGDLEKSKKWREIKEAIDSGTIDLQDEDRREILIAGITFKFASVIGHYKRMDHIYKKIKKLKRGEGILANRWAETKKEYDDFMSLERASLEGGNGPKVYTIDQSKIIRPIWFDKIKFEKVNDDNDRDHDNDSEVECDMKSDVHAVSDNKQHEPYVEFELRKNLKFSVGKNEKGNDFIRSKWANKDDLWFHIDGYKGAHLIVKVKSIGELSEEELKLVGSVLCEYSKLNITIIPLVFTQVKNIKGVKGHSGKVIVNKQRHIQVEYIKNWKELLEKSIEG
ncbi:MAG: DUF814 domain-containing protein [Oligoflexia bacterium]|nr:DUF814 domain-containing protein [Oligoflexia bacterium]